MNLSLKRYFWITFLYFFSGMPLGFFYTFLPVFFRSQGVDLVQIGLLSSAGIFWSLKPLWAPLVDAYGVKSRWMGFSLLGISLSIALITMNTTHINYLFLSLLILTFFSALFDTALDGFLIDYIPREEYGKANGLRLSAYRLALIFSGGILTALSGYLNFTLIFYLLSFLTGLSGLIILLNPSLSLAKRERRNYSIRALYWEPLKEIVSRERVFLLLLFIATYKIGDALLGGMIYPFWVDRGFTRVEIGLISGTLGSVFSILGSLLGGYITSKWGIKKSLLILGALQAFSNLGYAIAAIPFLDKRAVYIASILESFTGGLGTAAFLTFLTNLCHQRFSSSHYALFSTLFSITLVISRTISGFGAKYLGYFLFFSLTFVIALLPLVLIPFLFKEKIEKNTGYGR